MEEEETPSIIPRKELRRQKLMEYLTAKGKLKLSNPKLYPGDNCQVKNPVTSAIKVVKEKENNAPVNSSRYEARKVKTLAPQSTQHPARRAFSVINKVNIKGNILTAQQNVSRSSAISGPAQPKLNQNRVLTNTSSVSSKSNLCAPRHLRKQPRPGMQSSAKVSSNAACTALAKSNSRFSSSSSVSWSGPDSVRMSLGPIVKTKTGLVPALIQPRNSNLTCTAATAVGTTSSTNTSVANKVRSRTSSSVSVSRSSSAAQRKTFSSTALNNPVHKKPTVSQSTRAVIKTQDQKKSNSKPLLGKHSQPSCKSGLQSSSTFSKCRTAPVKPEGRLGMPKINESVGHPTDRSTKQRPQAEGEKNGQPCKVASRTSSGPASRCSFRVVSGVTRAPVAQLGGKTKIPVYKNTESKKEYSSAKAPPPQTVTKRTNAPVMSQTVPRPARTISYSGKTTDTKRSKVPVRVVPQTEGKKPTAAQEERMSKLQAWREAKGISYKRPPMPVKPVVKCAVSLPQPFWATMEEEDETHSLVYAMERCLADCSKLLEEGCPLGPVKEVLSRLPTVSQRFAKYWMCQARLMEREGNLDVLPMFEEAVRVVLEPVDELRTVVFEILKKKDEIRASKEKEKEEEVPGTVENTPESSNDPVMIPSKPVRVLICGEKGDSSAVKYKITATPGGPASQKREPRVRVNGQELRFLTPVRRSVRIERASLTYPASLQDHDLCVASYNDLIAEEDKEKSEKQKDGETSPSPNNAVYVYRQNEALKDKVSVQLFYDEDGSPSVVTSSPPACN